MTTDKQGALAALLILAATALISAGLIVALRPWLQRYVLARPNARSSHATPTPQGGGIAVIAATAIGAGWMAWLGPDSFGNAIPVVLGAACCLAVLGIVDDLKPIPVIPRLALQLAVVALLMIALPSQAPLLEAIPIWLERALLVLGLLWFVNLANFMDGLDWMTLAEMLPVTLALAAFALFDKAPADILPITVALAGALLGFAPFNRPVARLFLGDVGSLPIGLLTGWCLIELAGTGALAAAILLPLYHLMDATITLLRRLARGEKVWEAHRSHFYQKATDNGFSVMSVSAHVFGLNLVLAGLAAMTLVWPS